MNRVLRRGVSVSVLLALAACGSKPETVFHSRIHGEWVDFQGAQTKVMWDRPGLLSTCAVDDPVPTSDGDERRLCLGLELDLGKVDAALAGQSLTIKGRAKGTSDTGEPAFTPEPEQHPAIRGAWAVLSCIASPGGAPYEQRVLGEFVLTRVEDRLEGELHLVAEGGMGGGACASGGDLSEFSFPFEARY
jgi:hypothetical protein